MKNRSRFAVLAVTAALAGAALPAAVPTGAAAKPIICRTYANAAIKAIDSGQSKAADTWTKLLLETKGCWDKD